jgi:hypothetical protein
MWADDVLFFGPQYFFLANFPVLYRRVDVFFSSFCDA